MQKNDPTYSTVYIDTLAHQYLTRCSDRSGIPSSALATMAAWGGITSLASRLNEAPPPFKKDGQRPDKLWTERTLMETGAWMTIRAYCQALEVDANHFARDCILAQKANFDRIHPVNARGFDSCRQRLFELEQKGETEKSVYGDQAL